MKKEIVVLCSIPDINDATSFYRAVGPLSHLRKTSPRPISYTIVDQFSWANVALADVVFFQRPSLDAHLKAMQLCKDMGKPIWVDYDDDLLNVPTDNPTYFIYGQINSQKNIMDMLEMADVVTVSTRDLANNLKEKGINKDFVVIPNSVDLSWFDWDKEIGKRNQLVVWRGSPSHFRDVLSVTPDLTTIINDSKGWEFEFIGDRLWFLTDRCNPERIAHTRPMTVPTYFKYMRQIAPKVVITPLVDSKFNRAKSNIAWMEATLSGAVCVCSNLPEWQDSGAMRYISKPDGSSTFSQVLTHCMSMDDEEHTEMVDNSWGAIRSKYNLDIQNKKRLDILEKLNGS